MDTTRRRFFRRAAGLSSPGKPDHLDMAALATRGALAGGLGATAQVARAAQAAQAAQAASTAASDFKALVCPCMSGGNDSHN